MAGYGLQASGKLGSGDLCEDLYFARSADSARIMIHDAVEAVAAGDATSGAINGTSVRGVAVVSATSGSGTLIGVVNSVFPVVNNTSMIDVQTNYRVASTAQYVTVTIDPYAIYTVASNTTTDSTHLNLNVDLDVTTNTGSTLTGLSGMMLKESTTPTTTSTLQMRILRFNRAVGNSVGTLNGYFDCIINNHEFKAGVTATSAT